MDLDLVVVGIAILCFSDIVILAKNGDATTTRAVDGIVVDDKGDSTYAHEEDEECDKIGTGFCGASLDDALAVNLLVKFSNQAILLFIERCG